MKNHTTHEKENGLSIKNNERFLYEKTLRKTDATNVWFYFPGPESFAMSSLGYLWLFKELDTDENIDVERVYTDSKTTRLMRSDIDVVGISMSFDMDFLSIFKFLDNNKFNLKSRDRKENEPLIYAGGPVITTNPEPYREIFDFMVIGDGEGLNNNIINIIGTMKNDNRPKGDILKELSKLEGIYVPDISKKVKKRLNDLN